MIITVFLAQLSYVFLLGIQSQNVRDRQYLGAAATSLLLGLATVYIQPALIRSALLTPDPAILVSYVLAGPIGICLSMLLHPVLRSRPHRKIDSHKPQR